MLYSRWRPDRGDYDYFETTERRGLGDDLPVPSLPMGTTIGVASTSIGRTTAARLRPLGHGPVAKGSILPMSRAGLSGSVSGMEVSMTGMVGLALACAAGYFFGRRRR